MSKHSENAAGGICLEEDRASELRESATTQPENPRRSERVRTLTEKGREFNREKLNELLLRFETIYERWKALAKLAKKSILKRDPNVILQEHINCIQKEESELNGVYEEYRKVDSPPHNMRRQLDSCTSVTKAVIQNIQSQMQGANEQLHWPDAHSVFASSSSSVSLSASEHSKERSVPSVVSSLRQGAAAEYEATKAVLHIMAEQECQREKLQKLQAEDQLIKAEEKAAAFSRKLQREKEETERRISEEKEEEAILKEQQVKNFERKQTVESLKRDVKRLEELKKLHAAKAKLQVYDENDSCKSHAVSLCSEVSKNMQQDFSVSKYVHPNTASNVEIKPQHDTVELVKVLAEAVSASRLPIPEPTIFYGDPLKFKHWKSSFQTLIERKNILVTEKMFFLQKYVGGAAKEAIEGHFLTGTEASYEAAWNLLNERFGDSFIIAKAYRDKLYAWPKVASRESSELRKFVDFLRSCECAMTENDHLSVLNDGIENQKLISKLPDWLSAAWNRKATEYQLENRRFPKFSYFVTFLTMEANIACNPITSFSALRQSESDKNQVKSHRTISPRNQVLGAKSFSTSVKEKNIETCVFCKKVGHALHKCRILAKKPLNERIRFVQSEKLCFGCFRPGHFSKNCKVRMQCTVCSKNHPTCLHEDRPNQRLQMMDEQSSEIHQAEERNASSTQQPPEIVEKSTSNRVLKEGNSAQTSAIVPVYVSSSSEPNKEILTYALLDSQSDSSFILDEVADSLGVDLEQVKLKLSTMSSKVTIIPCGKIQELQIRGVFSTKRITVPVVYTREFIPANREHIPTPQTAKVWPHLEHLAENIAPLKQCEIGLLIGYNCPQALLPREVVCGEENQPYAQKTDLGWSIVSYVDASEHHSDPIGVSHRIIVRQVTPVPKSTVKLKGEVHYVCKTQIKEMVTPEDVIKMLESDFSEKTSEEVTVSQDDLKFLSALKNGIKQKAEQLQTSNWFKGPEFLWRKDLPIGDSKVGEVKDDDPELKRVQVLSTETKTQKTLLDYLTKFSDWKRAVKAIACLKRLAKQIKGLKPKVNEPTSLQERREAELFIIQLAQEKAFNREIKSIRQYKEIKPKDKGNKLYKLSPFVDEHGILRVGGRLTRSCLHPHVKHPAILPKASHVSSLIIKHHHEKVHHQGRGMTVNELRSNGIWIIGCGSAVSSHINKCIICRKYRRNTQDPKMADLPEDRMATTPPFTYCGMDCFGPFFVKDGRKEMKKYGLLFNCMCSRAVHIEMLDDLSTDAFINALRSFIAIRGKVRQLRCDQGTNFVGANREFLKAMKDMKHEQLKEYGCEFLLNTPSSSHMGGVWERQIKTIRSVLTAILDHSAKRLDSSSLRTFLYEVMAIINSRPLTAEFLNDPTSYEPLTPNHILMMKSDIVSPPPGEFVSQDLYLRKRWRQVQFLANDFWTRWKKEYLLNLQQRQKWQENRRDTKVNDIVILQDDNTLRNHWRLAKVTEVYPSSDGRIRKVKLLLSDSTLSSQGRRTTKPVYLDRPVHKTVLLLEATE